MELKTHWRPSSGELWVVEIVAVVAALMAVVAIEAIEETAGMVAMMRVLAVAAEGRVPARGCEAVPHPKMGKSFETDAAGSLKGQANLNNWVGLWHLQNYRVRTPGCEAVLCHKIRKNFPGAGEVVKDYRWIGKVLLHQLVAIRRNFKTALH